MNGKIVPLRYKLKNGDTVEVLTSPTAHPSKDWLDVRQDLAARRQAIRAFIKPAARASLDIGRELLEREFKRFDLNFNK